jgi:hypothetical protein
MKHGKMEFEMKYKNVNLAWNDKLIMLNMKIENFFQLFWIERNMTRAIIISLMSPLLLHVMFFMMQNVRAFCGIA